MFDSSQDCPASLKVEPFCWGCTRGAAPLTKESTKTEDHRDGDWGREGFILTTPPINIVARRGSRDGGVGQRSFEPVQGTERLKQSIYCNKWKSKLSLKLQFKAHLFLFFSFLFSHVCRCPSHGGFFFFCRTFCSQLMSSVNEKFHRKFFPVNYIKGKSIRDIFWRHRSYPENVTYQLWQCTFFPPAFQRDAIQSCVLAPNTP